MSGEESETPTKAKSRRKTSGKGSRSDGRSGYGSKDDDPEGEFEDTPDSEQADDAQQTIGELEDEVAAEVDEGGVEVEGVEDEGSAAGGAPGGTGGGAVTGEGGQSGVSATDEADTGDGDIVIGSEMEEWEPGETVPDDDLQEAFQRAREESQQEVTAQPDADLETRIENGEKPSITPENLDEWQEYDPNLEIDESFFEEDLTPDAPDNLNIDNIDEFRPLDFEEENTGVSVDSMFVGEINGQRVFLTVDSVRSPGYPGQGVKLAEAVEESIEDDADGPEVKFPPMHFDEERSTSVLGDVAKVDTDRDDLEAKAAFAARSDADFPNLDREEYMTGLSTKLVIGDTDVGANVMQRSDGECYPIDFDLAGNDLDDKGGKERDAFEKALTRSTEPSAPFDISREELERHTQKVADQINREKLEERLEEKEVRAKTAENVKKNVRKLQEREEFE